MRNGTVELRVSAVLVNRSAPAATVTPVLVYDDVRAVVAWLAAFGFEERVRIGDGHRAQLRVGSDGAVGVVAEADAIELPERPGYAHRQGAGTGRRCGLCPARDAGARVVEELTTWEYGEGARASSRTSAATAAGRPDGARRRPRGMGWDVDRPLVRADPPGHAFGHVGAGEDVGGVLRWRHARTCIAGWTR